MTPTGAFHQFEHQGWERAANAYDGGFGDLTQQSVAPLLNAIDPVPGCRVLDVACGPGYAAAEAARRGLAATGVDFSVAMIAAAQSRYPGIDFREGDASNLEFPDGAFDAVIMNFGMLHLEAPDRAVQEAFRVLRPGGRYAFTVWDLPKQAVGFDIILGTIESHGNTAITLPPGPPFFRFSDPLECRRTLESVGFANVASQQTSQLWRLSSRDDLFATFMTAAVRTAALLRGQTPEALERIRREAALRVDAFQSADGFVIPMPSILTSASKPA